jgi:hypothetical protein
MPPQIVDTIETDLFDISLDWTNLNTPEIQFIQIDRSVEYSFLSFLFLNLN